LQLPKAREHSRMRTRARSAVTFIRRSAVCNEGLRAPRRRSS
jgi:hypothetical protein